MGAGKKAVSKQLLQVLVRLLARLADLEFEHGGRESSSADQGQP